MKLFDWIIWFFEKACVILLAVCVAITFSQAIARYFLGASIMWSEEIAVLCMVWIGFFGSGIAWKRNSHTRIDFLINRLPPKVKKWVEVFDCTVCAVFLGILMKYITVIYQLTARRMSPVSGLRLSMPYLGMLIGSVLMIVYLLMLAVCKAIDYAPQPPPAKGGETK